MPGGGGGGADTSGMEQATREANQLNREIYEQSLDRGEPFYDVGVGGLRALADRVGLPGGTMQTEAQVREQLLPQFTTAAQAPGGQAGDFTFSEAEMRRAAELRPQYQDAMNRGMADDFINRRLSGADQRSTAFRNLVRGNDFDFAGAATGATQEVVDTAALDAAVAAQMANQQNPQNYGDLLQPFSMDDYQQDPGYLFRLAQGEQAINRAAAARGNRFAPRTVQELTEYGQGLASQEYGNAYNRYNIDQQNVFNRLAGIAGIGQGQVAQLDMAGQQYAGNTSQNLFSLANARAAADQAARSERSSMFGNILGLGGRLGGAYLGGI